MPKIDFVLPLFFVSLFLKKFSSTHHFYHYIITNAIKLIWCSFYLVLVLAALRSVSDVGAHLIGKGDHLQ